MYSKRGTIHSLIYLKIDGYIILCIVEWILDKIDLKIEL